MTSLKNTLTKVMAISASNFEKKGDRPQFLKAIYNDGKVTILEGQSSAMLHTFAIANAIVYKPEEVSKYSKGYLITVLHLPV